MPEYTEGYLTPGKFDSEADYKECMRRLSKLLYAGYPYNGERLYKIVDNSELHTPTESQFRNADSDTGASDSVSVFRSPFFYL